MEILSIVPKSISKQVEVIREICNNNRLVEKRIKELNKAGFSVRSKPHLNGGGVGSIVKLKNGEFRVRVSATYAAPKGGTYAKVVTLY